MRGGGGQGPQPEEGGLGTELWGAEAGGICVEECGTHSGGFFVFDGLGIRNALGSNCSALVVVSGRSDFVIATFSRPPRPGVSMECATLASENAPRQP